MKIALIGTGSMARSHAKSIKEIKGAKLVAVYGRSPERTRKFAKEFNIKPYENYDELLKQDIDIIDVATINNLHADLGIKAAKTKKHILTEKPIDISLDKADELIKICKENDVRLGVISQLRFSPILKKIKEKIIKGELGDIISINITMNWYKKSDYYNNWRGDPKQAGGGVLMLQSIHYVDLLRWFLGPAKKVLGVVNTVDKNLKVENTVTGIISFKNNSIGIINASTASNSTLPDRIEIFGTKGSVTIEGYMNAFYRVTRYIKGSNSFLDRFKYFLVSSLYKLRIKRSGKIKDQIEEFIESVGTETIPMVSGEDGRNALELVLAIYKSSEVGGEITL